VTGPPVTVTHVEVHIVAERPGVWCDTCALPSAVELDTVLVGPKCLTVIARDTVTVCGDCGHVDLRARSDTA